jgi:hypothetical protein
MGGACNTYGKGRGTYKILVAKPEEKRLFRRSSRRLRIILEWILGK